MATVTLPANNYAGYIFDLDGTLVDSMEVHFRAWRLALAAHGAPPEVFAGDEFIQYGGRAALDIVQSLNASYGLSMDPHAVAGEKRDLYLQLLAEGALQGISQTVDLVRDLAARGIPYAIGTGSAPKGARATLQAIGIEELFPIIVTPEDVPAGRGKPMPDIFLLCAERMGVDPSQCVVFEDAQPGIDAALAAGMDYVFVDSIDIPRWNHAAGVS